MLLSCVLNIYFSQHLRPWQAVFWSSKYDPYWSSLQADIKISGSSKILFLITLLCVVHYVWHSFHSCNQHVTVHICMVFTNINLCVLILTITMSKACITLIMVNVLLTSNNHFVSINAPAVSEACITLITFISFKTSVNSSILYTCIVLILGIRFDVKYEYQYETPLSDRFVRDSSVSFQFNDVLHLQNYSCAHCIVNWGQYQCYFMIGVHLLLFDYRWVDFFQLWKTAA